MKFKVRNRYLLPIFTLTVSVLGLYCSSTFAQNKENYFVSAPSVATKTALEKIVTTADPKLSTEIQVKKYRVEPSEPGVSVGSDAPKSALQVPLLIPDTIILQLRPDLSEEEIDSLIEEKNLKVISVYSNIGQLKAEVDLAKYFTAKLGDEPNEALLRGILETSKSFKEDPRIIGATPDVLISTQRWKDSYAGNMSVADPTAINPGEEQTDWGVADIGADTLWATANADNPVLIGVMDVGFKEHEDLVFKDLSQNMTSHNHGNHVAGIACAKHNQTGIKGVLPVCWVKAEKGGFFPPDDQADAVSVFMVQFSQILATLNAFVPDSNEIETYNISLGYNWMSNFGINPDSAGSEIYRAMTQMQGELFLSILEVAGAQGKVIFSAAGNDSHGLPTPIESKYASPFNWAAHTARERGISRNGVVVEAHGPGGNRASFSNTGGHLSCPGVDILSTTADADNSYGVMSGTSMASPYCAAGFALLKNLLTEKTAVEILDCMEQSPNVSSSGTPRVELVTAIELCS